MTRRSARAAIALTVVAAMTSLVPATPASADAPACTPPAPVVVGSRYGLTVEVRPCADPTGVASYRLTGYRSGPPVGEPFLRDLPAGSHVVRAVRAQPWQPIPTHIFRARALGPDGELGPLGPSSAGAPSPFTTSSAAVNQGYVDFLGRNPTSTERSAGVSIVNQHGLYYLYDQLAHDPSLTPQAEVARLFLAVDLNIDRAGLTYWTARRRAGTSLTRIADALLASERGRQLWGPRSNEHFARLVYESARFHDPSPEDLARWTAQLDSKVRSRGNLVAVLSTPSSVNTGQQLEVLAVTFMAALPRAIATRDRIRSLMGEVEYDGGLLELVVLTDQRYVERVSNVGPPLIMPGIQLPGGTVGERYGQTLHAEPGTGVLPRAFTISGLPPGLTFASNIVSGTPTAAGTYAVVVTLTDALGLHDQRTYPVTIQPPDA